MRLDTLGWKPNKVNTWHHYKRPAVSVGEDGDGRRQSRGHRPRALAERALVPDGPSIEEFPYPIRVVSDILESNGSSRASVCGSSIALMDAGVQIKRPLAASRWASSRRAMNKSSDRT